MSDSGQAEIKKEQGYLLSGQLNAKSDDKRQEIQSKSCRIGIQRSSFMQQQDIASEEQHRKDQKLLDKQIYISHYGNNKETTFNITKTQIPQKQLQKKHDERQEYQSISSGRSSKKSNPTITIDNKLNHKVPQQRSSLGGDGNKSYSSSNQRPSQSNNMNLKQIHPYDDKKYPSLQKYQSQFRSSTNSRQLNTESVGNSLNSQHKNYALTMKKITSSQKSPKKRSQSLDKNVMSKTSSYQQKKELIRSFDTNDNTKKQKQTPSRNRSIHMNNYQMDINEPAEPNLFYISISGKQMYPSLDLKKEAISNEKECNLPEGKISESRQDNKSKIVRKSQQKQQVTLDTALPYSIKICQYRSEYFLKVETQVFTIQVQYPPAGKQVQLQSMNSKGLTNGNQSKPKGEVYEIQRRFSDFVFLYESIMTNHLGYIIYPFPEKSFESFLKIKLQSFIGNAIISDPASEYEAEKMQLIQRRIQELEKFVNFLLQHQQLKYSEELAIFLTPDPQLYTRSKERIAKYIQEYKQLESSGNILEEGRKNIKKVIETGYGMVMKWWSSSEQKNAQITKSSQTANNKIKSTTLTIPTSEQHQLHQQFNHYSQMIQTCHSKYHMLEKSFIKLSQTYKKILLFKDIDTDFDYLMKLSAKMSSGKEFIKNAAEVIDEEVLKQIQTERRWLQQAKMQLDKRQELKLLIEQLQATLGYNKELSSKISKLSRRLERFEKNFRLGFNDLIEGCQETFESSKTRFQREWQAHCLNMRRIWK